MTKINRIVLHGFKSFAHKTEIPFEDKFNCILGPNGAGKSNVADALCFVLGRLSSKSLRAEKSANMIFHGGKNKGPSPGGYVEIAFDNTPKIFPLDAPEVVITRTLTKKGNSIYRLNGQKRTRTEILDQLSAAKINPEGYNIVLQGDITHFVDMTPLERRLVIEGISDVSIYEEKKHKALLELKKVEEQLSNAELILKERKTYLKELKKDRDQAFQFKELKGKIDSYKATYLYLQIREREAIKKKYDLEVAEHERKIAQTEKQIASLKEKATGCKGKVAQINEEIERKGEKEQIEVHRHLEDLKVALAKEKARTSTLKDEINKIRQRQDQFQMEIKELEEKSVAYSRERQELEQKIAGKKKELEETERKIAEFKKRNRIETSQQLEKELEEKDRLIEQRQEEVQQIRQRQQELLREKDRWEYQLQTLEERIKKVRAVEQENQEQMQKLQQLKTDFKTATLRLNQLLEQDSSFAAQTSQARQRIAEMQEKEAQLNARTLAWQAGLAANQAVKSVLENKKRFKGVHGTIAGLGQAQKKYSLALERAAGAKMQHLVVDDDQVAADCLNFLKTNKLGEASFIPLNKIRSPEISAEDQKLLQGKGRHDFALNLISFEPRYQKAFSYVFGNTLVVDDIDTVRQMGVGKIRMVTIDGNIAEASGVMRGGYIVPKASLGFKEKDSLEELEKISSEIAGLQRVISSVGTRREANEKEISALRTKKGELEGGMIKLEKSLHLDSQDREASTELKKEWQEKLKEANASLDGIQKNISRINKDLVELKSQKQLLRSEVSQLRDPQLLAQLSAFEESRQHGREDILKLEGERRSLLTRIESLIAPERDKIREILKQHRKEETQFNEEIKTLEVSVGKKERELVLKEKESQDFYSRYRDLFAQREKLNAEIAKSENETENGREKMRGSEREMNLVSLKNAEIKAKLAGLQEEFNRYQKVEILREKKADELQPEINQFEVMLAQMSTVNMKALEVYELVEKEYNKLVEKKASLDKEKTDVLAFMNELETKKKEHFMKTFDWVNENFQRVFSSLFTKGKAYLQLDNSSSPFEDGLSIKVRIKGNQFMDIRSLSGGEKTLTALSLIFAIQEFQPASFYVLDEIDAALDKHNSETLAKIIRHYADQAQYIIISHNDAIISEADTLFGVSMNDGVSKVTSLKI